MTSQEINNVGTHLLHTLKGKVPVSMLKEAEIRARGTMNTAKNMQMSR